MANHEVCTPANVIVARALAEHGKSTTEIAKELRVSQSSAWRMTKDLSVDPETVQLASKTIADKLLQSANVMADTLLEKAYNGELDKESALSLAKASSIMLQSSGAYAALSGAKDTWLTLQEQFGIAASHSVSRVTVTRQVTTVETAPTLANTAQVIECTASVAPHQGVSGGEHAD